MISAGIKELKNNLSRYISQVKKDEDILVTKRGKAIARIIKEDSKELHLREVLRPLLALELVETQSDDIHDQCEVTGWHTGFCQNSSQPF